MIDRVLAIETIVSNPAVRGGRPIIAGTGIMVSDIAAYTSFQGMTPDDLAVQLGLTLGQVHAALAYYYDHQAEIDAEIRANRAEAEALLKQLGDE